MVQYKDSGIKWIGKIPFDWDIKKIKYVSDFINGFGFKSERFCDDGVRVIRISDFNENGFVNENPVFYKFTPVLNKAKILKNDILICMTGGTVGKSFYIDFIDDLNFINQRVGIIRAKEIDPKFLYYIIYSSYIQQRIKTSITSINDNISQSDIANSTIFVPPDEQVNKIVDCLDKKCQKIDEISSLIEKQIEKLNEYKKSLIYECVTKGLNKNIEYKDSGIKWFSKINNEIKILKIKNVVDEFYSGATPESSNTLFYTNDNNGINWLAIRDMSTVKYVSDSAKKITPLARATYTLKILDPGTIIYSIYASIGKVSELLIPACINQAIMSFKLKKEVNKMYFKFYLELIEDFVQVESSSNTQPNLTLSKVKNFPFLMPTRAYQDQVADFLNKKCQKIDDIVNLKKKQLEKMEQYKKSLIYECVTGKREV